VRQEQDLFEVVGDECVVEPGVATVAPVCAPAIADKNDPATSMTTDAYANDSVQTSNRSLRGNHPWSLRKKEGRRHADSEDRNACIADGSLYLVNVSPPRFRRTAEDLQPSRRFPASGRGHHQVWAIGFRRLAIVFKCLRGLIHGATHG